MQSLLQMLHNSTTQQQPSDGESAVSGVQEDAILAISALVERLGPGFVQYMPSFRQYLLQTLKNTAEYQVCYVAVNCVGDLARALQLQLKPYADEIMMILLEILGNDKVERSVKPAVLSVFGDIALGMGPDFQTYLEVVVNTLKAASSIVVDKNDYDMVDYMNELRENCLEAYTGIVQGLKGENGSGSKVELLLPHAASVIEFIEVIGNDPDKSDGVIGAACGLIGDLTMAFGPQVAPLCEKEAINNLLQAGRRSKTAKTKTLAVWATKELRKLKPAS